MELGRFQKHRNYRIQTWTRRHSGKQSDPSFPRKLINGGGKSYLRNKMKAEEIFMDYFKNVTDTIDVPKYDPPDKAYVDIFSGYRKFQTPRKIKPLMQKFLFMFYNGMGTYAYPLD